MSGESLASVVAETASELEDVERIDRDGQVEFSRGGRPFAALDSDGSASFRLGPQVAQAALRTPDTHPSPRGPNWVSFRPAQLDRFARDRAEAWLEVAHRFAGRG